MINLKFKRGFVLVLVILLFFTMGASAQQRSPEEERYVNALKNSYFPGLQHKALTVGQVLGGLEKSINNNGNLGGNYSFKVSNAPQVGRGQGKYVQMVLTINNTAISTHFWVNQKKSYIEYLGGEMNDNGNQIADGNQVMRFINMAYNTALEVQ